MAMVLLAFFQLLCPFLGWILGRFRSNFQVSSKSHPKASELGQNTIGTGFSTIKIGGNHAQGTHFYKPRCAMWGQGSKVPEMCCMHAWWGPGTFRLTVMTGTSPAVGDYVM